MRKLPYTVTLFSPDGEPTSQCKYPTERAARKKFRKCVTSAECANIGRILLVRIDLPAPGMFGRSRIGWVNLDEWIKPEPEFQTAGYIVHSARTLNDTTTCKPVNKTFHETADGAVRAASQLADTWSEGHEGLIVFKAIMHVHKEGYYRSRSTRIRVDNVE